MTRPKPLKPIYIRLREDDVQTARKVARRERLPYQRVLRGWITEMASRALI